MRHSGMGALTIISLAALLGIASWAQLTPLQPVHLGLLMTDIHLDPVTVNPPNPNFPESEAIHLLETTNIDDWPAQFAKFQTQVVNVKVTPNMDANYPLFDAALTNAANKTLVKGTFDYVIFTGDMLRHNFPRSNPQEQVLAQNAAAFVVREITRKFNVPVFAALGNNDSDNCDYGIKPGPNNPFLDAVANEMTVLKSNPAADSDFRTGGYFVAPHPTVSNQDIIVLNSVFWSKSYLTRCGGPYTDAPGVQEMSWLDSALGKAAQQHHGVTLVMHIPPGVDPHSSQPGSARSLFWTDQFNDMFAKTIAKYSPVIPVAFAGHSHLDDFRSFDQVSPVPWRIGLAVSPVFGNNPGFSTFSYDPKTAVITDLTTFTAAAGSATFTFEYGFNHAYQVKGYTAASLDAVNSVLRTCQTKCGDIKTFEKYYKPGSSWGNNNLTNIACSQKHFSAPDVQTCVSGSTAK